MRVLWTARRSNQSILKEILKEMYPKGNPKGNILKEMNPEFIGRTDAEAPILWPSDARS